jgi:hypothetical protein
MGTTWLKRQTLTSWRHAAFDIRFIGITFFELIDSSLLKHGQLWVFMLYRHA